MSRGPLFLYLPPPPRSSGTRAGFTVNGPCWSDKMELLALRSRAGEDDNKVSCQLEQLHGVSYWRLWDLWGSNLSRECSVGDTFCERYIFFRDRDNLG